MAKSRPTVQVGPNCRGICPPVWIARRRIGGHAPLNIKKSHPQQLLTYLGRREFGAAIDSRLAMPDHNQRIGEVTSVGGISSALAREVICRSDERGGLEKRSPSRGGPRVRILLSPAQSQSLARIHFRRSRTPAFRAGVRGWLGDRVGRDAQGGSISDMATGSEKTGGTGSRRHGGLWLPHSSRPTQARHSSDHGYRTNHVFRPQ
jgi:hypothetical protein